MNISKSNNPMRIALLLLCCMAIVFATATASFADSRVAYAGNAKGFIFTTEGATPTDLFENFKGVMPGDTLTQKIVVRNDAGKDVDVHLYLRSLGGTEETKDFLSQMTLKVAKADGTVLSEAAADQSAGLTEWQDLGAFASGQETELVLTLTVPIEMGNDFQQAIGNVTWEFRADETPVSAGGKDNATQTGDDSNMLALFGLMAVAAAAGAYVYLNRRKQADN